MADMSITPDRVVPYPDPDESTEIIEDRIEQDLLGTVLYVREWRGDDGMVEQFALMLNITSDYPAYRHVKEFKSSEENFEQVRRTDTWHSTVHSHQYFIDSAYCEREVHEELAGGIQEAESRRTVNGAFQKYYYEMLYNPFDYLERWEGGTP